jgi:ligand-binding SRPBCC domain-containing protein
MAIQHTLEACLHVPLDRADLFPFFCDAFNLERITPRELCFRVLTPRPIEMREGARIDYRLSLWGIPFSWQTEISCWEPPLRFVDRQISGPYRRWEHLHEFIPGDQGTKILDRVDYALPLSPLSECMHPLLRRQLSRIFLYRQQALKQLFCPSADTEYGVIIDGHAGEDG